MGTRERGGQGGGGIEGVGGMGRLLTYKNILDAPPGEVEGVQVGVGEGVLETVGEGEGEDEGEAPIPFGSETTLTWVPHSAAPAPYK